MKIQLLNLLAATPETADAPESPETPEVVHTPAAPTSQGNRPTGVTILGVLYYIGSIFAIIAGLLMMVGGAAFLGALAAAGIVVGLLVLVIGVVGVWFTRNFMRGTPWAWTVTVVLEALSLLNGLLTLFSNASSGIVGLILAGVIIWYMFTDPAKAYFGKSDVKTPWEGLGKGSGS